MKRRAWKVLATVADRAHLTGRLTPTGNLILMYHSIGGTYGNPSGPMTASRLRDDLNYFSKQFSFVDLPDVLEASEEPRLAITFDDGYRDFLTDALPVLESIGSPATVFLITDLLKDDCPEPSQFGLDASRSEMLASEDIYRLVDHGLVTIGNHTATHPDLPSLGAEALHREIQGAQQMLEEQYNVTIDRFCYPGGKHDAHSRAVVAETHDIAVDVSMGFIYPPVTTQETVTLPRVDGANPPPVLQWEASYFGDVFSRGYRQAKTVFKTVYK